MSVVIDDTDELYRRLVAAHIEPDGRINSGAFKTRPGTGISVNLARLSSVEETIAQGRHPGAGVGALVAKVPRGLGRDVIHDPTPENQAHAELRGACSRSACRVLAESTSILTRPSDPPSRG